MLLKNLYFKSIWYRLDINFSIFDMKAALKSLHHLFMALLFRAWQSGTKTVLVCKMSKKNKVMLRHRQTEMLLNLVTLSLLLLPRRCRPAGSARDLWPGAHWSCRRAVWLRRYVSAVRRHSAQAAGYYTTLGWRRIPAAGWGHQK